MIQFRLESRYTSELDTLLKQWQQQYPLKSATTAPAPFAPRKRPADSLPFSLKTTRRPDTETVTSR